MYNGHHYTLMDLDHVLSSQKSRREGLSLNRPEDVTHPVFVWTH